MPKKILCHAALHGELDKPDSTPRAFSLMPWKLRFSSRYYVVRSAP
jgi:hypothetical protein